MPHLCLEYSPGLERRVDMNQVCSALHNAMMAAGIFPIAGIRIRAFRADHAITADGLLENDFLAMTLSVGQGRSKAALAQAGAQIMATAETALAHPLSTPHFALSLEIREIDPDLSWKNTPIHQRLSNAVQRARQ